MKGKGRLVQAVAGIAISAVALWLTLRGKEVLEYEKGRVL